MPANKKVNESTSIQKIDHETGIIEALQDQRLSHTETALELRVRKLQAIQENQERLNELKKLDQILDEAEAALKVKIRLEEQQAELDKIENQNFELTEAVTAKKKTVDRLRKLKFID